MSPREQALENFRKLQQQIRKNTFLKDAGQSSNEDAKALLNLTYDLMERLGWPDDGWRPETHLNGFPRHFYSGSRLSIGLIVSATVLNRRLEIAIELSVPQSTNTSHRLVVNNRIIGPLQQNDGILSLDDNIFEAARNEIIALAVSIPEKTSEEA